VQAAGRQQARNSDSTYIESCKQLAGRGLGTNWNSAEGPLPLRRQSFGILEIMLEIRIKDIGAPIVDNCVDCDIVYKVSF
jgi:hypothetical protein